MENDRIEVEESSVRKNCISSQHLQVSSKISRTIPCSVTPQWPFVSVYILLICSEIVTRALYNFPGWKWSEFIFTLSFPYSLLRRFAFNNEHRDDGLEVSPRFGGVVLLSQRHSVEFSERSILIIPRVAQFAPATFENDACPEFHRKYTDVISFFHARYESEGSSIVTAITHLSIFQACFRMLAQK